MRRFRGIFILSLILWGFSAPSAWAVPPGVSASGGSTGIQSRNSGVIAAPGGSAANAGAPSAPGPKGDPELENPVYEECDQHCLLDKAAENISLQAGVIEDQVVEVAKNGKGDRLDRFCASIPNDCEKAYVALGKILLYKLRNSLRLTQSAALELESKSRSMDPKGVVVSGQVVDRKAPPKKVQTPYLPTYGELAGYAAKMKPPSQKDYEWWVDQVTAQVDCTSQAKDGFLQNFVKFKVYDPADPKKGQVAVRKPNGEYDLDTAECNHALLTLQTKDALDSGSVKLPTLQQSMKQTTIKPNYFQLNFEKPVPVPTSASDQDLYNQNRGVLVDGANFDNKKLGLPNAASGGPGKQRAPAAKTPGFVNKYGRYTGKETLDPPANNSGSGSSVDSSAFQPEEFSPDNIQRQIDGQ